MRNLNARDMLRFQTCEALLGCNQLTQELRYEQVRMTRRLRNFFFTATHHPVVNPLPNQRLLARTPTFSDPLIITEIISLFDFSTVDPQTLPVEVFEYGGRERSLGLDYFGLSGRVPQRYILKHEKNRSIEAGFVAPAGEPDLQGRYIGYIPRLLAPFQQLEFDWTAYHPGFATGFIAVGVANPANGETLTVNGVLFTFVNVLVNPTDILIGATGPETIANIFAELSASANPAITAATYEANDSQVLITFGVSGPVGNAFTLATTAVNVTLNGATLTGGSLAAATDAVNLHLQSGVRSVRVLPNDNPYAYAGASNDAAIRNYIEGSEPETFFLEAVLPFPNFPAVGGTIQIKTPQMERPLMVLGASTNLEGVQADLVDESKYYQFTVADQPLTKQPLVPLYKSPPLSLWAANADFRNYNLYHMWAVPHLLDRGCQFVIKITNGLTPDTAGTFTEIARTKSEQYGRITFLCRTV